MLVPASVAAAVAGFLVVIIGLIVRKPLARVPENTLKFTVGVLLSAFGVLWIGERLRFPWLAQDLALVGLIGGFLSVSAVAVILPKRPVERTA